MTIQSVERTAEILSLFSLHRTALGVTEIANELGLGTLTYKPKDMLFLNEILDVEDKYMVELIIPVGYSADKARKQQRKDLHDVVSWV